MRCPACTSELRAFDTTAGRVMRCETGHGTSISLPVLRRRFDETVALWRAASRQPKGGRPCPSCTSPMRTFSWESGAEHVELDACSPCQLVWFDAAEIEALKVRLVERRPGTTVEGPVLQASGGATIGSSKESSWLENVVDGLDLLQLLSFFDF